MIRAWVVRSVVFGAVSARRVAGIGFNLAAKSKRPANSEEIDGPGESTTGLLFNDNYSVAWNSITDSSGVSICL